MQKGARTEASMGLREMNMSFCSLGSQSGVSDPKWGRKLSQGWTGVAGVAQSKCN